MNDVVETVTMSLEKYEVMKKTISDLEDALNKEISEHKKTKDVLNRIRLPREVFEYMKKASSAIPVVSYSEDIDTMMRKYHITIAISSDELYENSLY